ncbi:MAG TPA: cytochrome c-type biogenesis protein [Casimicrobiaceae bacterium]|nr:cytochrome c-type biogenesis protein [Casimicrobiaceae bacterium]
MKSPSRGGWVAHFAIVAAGIAFWSHAMADDALDARLKSLESQLRCLVCQNQTLAESEAPLAADLRKEVRELAVSGKSDDDIRAYLVARYGDFVLYKPPVKPITWLLWFGPFVLLGAAATAWWRVLRARSRASLDVVPQNDAAASVSVARARELLDG